MRKPIPKPEKIGEKSRANNGQMMEIVEYKKYRDVTIKFEDGTIVTGKSYDKFKCGEIGNPSLSLAKKRVKEKNRAHNGQMMEIIEYIAADNITIRFENGTILKNQNYNAFKSGHIMNKKDRYTLEGVAHNGQKMKIIAYRKAKDIDVQFEDGTIVYNKNYYCFLKGSIRNPKFVYPKRPRKKKVKEV